MFTNKSEDKSSGLTGFLVFAFFKLAINGGFIDLLNEN